MITTQQIKINADVARSFLANNKHNRPVSKRNLKRLCNDMREGRWVFNADPIRFAEDGTLIDGQHRLLAVMETGIEITALVVFGLPNDAFATIDTHNPRSGSDVIAIGGDENSVTVAAAILLVKKIQTGRITTSDTYTNQQIIEFRSSMPGIIDSVKFAREARGIVPTSVIAAMHYLFTEIGGDLGIEFMEKLCYGENINSKSIIYLLRERMIANSISKQGKLPRLVMLALIIKSWNLFIEKRPAKMIKYDVMREEFPKINKPEMKG